MTGWTDRLRRSRLGSLARDYPITAFVATTFAWTWGYGSVAILYFGDAPMLGPAPAVRVPAIWGPLLGAGAVVWIGGGSLREWAGQVKRWRVSPVWYLVAFVLPIALTELSTVVYLLAGVPVTYGGLPPLLYVGAFLLILLTMGSLEEFGWRGFAQPILQERYTALSAAVVVGVLWTLWHGYLFALGVPWTQDANVVLYALRLASSAVLFAWVYNGTGGSVLLVMIYHAAGNLPALYEPVGTVPGDVALVAGTSSIVVVQVLVATALVAVYGMRYLAGSSPAIDVPSALGR